MGRRQVAKQLQVVGYEGVQRKLACRLVLQHVHILKVHISRELPCYVLCMMYVCILICAIAHR